MLKALKNRAIIQVTGEDRVRLLQGLVTVDITSFSADRMRWGAFLTAQGRIIGTCFFAAKDESILIDCHQEELERIFSMLNFYKLKLKVSILKTSLVVAVGLNDEYGFKDPRLDGLGQRYFRSETDKSISNDATFDLESLEIKNGIFDYPQNPALPLLAYEQNLDLLNGIDWNKGCYLGQEITARVRYRGQEKKRVCVCHSETLTEKDQLLKDANGAEMAEILSFKDNVRWALVKKEYVGEDIEYQSQSSNGRVKFLKPNWMTFNKND